MISRPKSTGFDCRGTPACFPMSPGLARAGGPGRAASRRGRAAHHAAGYPQNRSFNQAPRRDRGISPVGRCSNAFTPPTR
jgi:hypothetical protein